MLRRAPILAFALGAAAGLGTLATADSGATEHAARETASPNPAAGPQLSVAPSQWPERIAARLAQVETSSAPARGAGEGLDEVGIAAGTAVHVRDLDTGRVVLDHAGERLQNPASNHKLVTAAAAVELLGPDYTFETRVSRHGDTLYLIGEGDPTLLVDDLYALASEIVARDEHIGVRRIVADDSAFSAASLGPGYDIQSDDAYMAPSGALSLQFNTVEIAVAPGEYGEAPIVRVSPASTMVRVENVALTGPGPEAGIDIRRDGATTVVRVAGAVPAGQGLEEQRRRVADPGSFTAGAFAEILATLADAQPLPVARGVAPAHADELAMHRSAPLSKVLGAALKFSNNFTAEQVLRTLGWRFDGRPGNWDNGAAAIRAWWQATGGDPHDLHFQNGAGLSRDGRVTARALVDVVSRTASSGSPAESLLPALAVAGREGTLAHRLEGARGRVRGKTGTLNGVSALTGVVVSRDGATRLGFSILMSNVRDSGDARRAQDAIVRRILEYAERSPA